jgi:hypothetical protein
VAAGVFVAVIGVLLLVISGLGYRVGAWSLAVGFHLLAIGAWICLAAGLLSILAAALTRPGSGRRGFVLSILGLLLGFGAFGVMLRWRIRASSSPPIHDITTDPANPPPFVAIVPLRVNAANPVAYGGDSIAARQRAAYPEIGPANLPIGASAAFVLALAQARHRKWDIVAADSAGGRIEATETTPWFGLANDVVIRITPTTPGSCRVDMRASSRVLHNDLGIDARIVRGFIAQLQHTVGAEESGGGEQP